MFRPFDIGKWFAIGFCAWLAGLIDQRGSSFDFGSGWSQDDADVPSGAGDFFRDPQMHRVTSKPQVRLGRLDNRVPMLTGNRHGSDSDTAHVLRRAVPKSTHSLNMFSGLRRFLFLAKTALRSNRVFPFKIPWVVRGPSGSINIASDAFRARRKHRSCRLMGTDPQTTGKSNAWRISSCCYSEEIR